MSSSGNVKREQLKQEARLARALEVLRQAPKEPIFESPLFERPRKLSRTPNDATALRVNDLLGPYDIIQPSIQKNSKELIGVRHRNSVSSVNGITTNEKPNGVYPQKKADVKNVESGKQDGRSVKDPHGKLEQKPQGVPPGLDKRENKRSAERDISHKASEKEAKPNVEELAKYGGKHNTDLARKNSSKHIRQLSADKDSRHGRRKSADREHHRQKSSERDGSIPRQGCASVERDVKRDHASAERDVKRDHGSVERDVKREHASVERDVKRDHASVERDVKRDHASVERDVKRDHASVERDLKREDQTSVSSSSSERQSTSVDRQPGIRKEHSEQQQNAQKPQHRGGNIFARLKTEPEDVSGNKSRSNTNPLENTSSKTLIGKEADAKPLAPSVERQRTESSLSVASNGSATSESSASSVVKKEADTEKVKPLDRSMQPPNGIMVNGAFVKDLASSKLRGAQKNLPKLKISNEINKLPGEHGEKLEDILKEMKNIHAPLTGIHTPRKEEVLKFPFSKDVAHATKTLYANRKPVTPVEHPVKKEKSTGDNTLLLNDLAVSSDSDSDNDHDNQVFPKKQDTEHKSGKRPTARSRSRSTSSESSENGSDSSSESNSESGSSSDDAEEVPETCKKEEEVATEEGKDNENGAWGLKHYLDQIKETNSSLSPCAKQTATPTPAPAPQPVTEPVNDGLDFDNWKDSWKHIGVPEEVPPLIQRIIDKKDQAWDPGRHSLFSTDDEDHGHHSDIDEGNHLGINAKSNDSKSVSPSVHTEITKNGGIKLTIGRMNEGNVKKQRTNSASEMTISKSPQINQKSAKLYKQASQPCLTQKSISNLVKKEPKAQSKSGSHTKCSSTPKEEKESISQSVPKSGGRTNKNQKYKSKAYLSSCDSSDEGDIDVVNTTPVKVLLSQSHKLQMPKPEPPTFAHSRSDSKDRSKKPKPRKEKTLSQRVDEPRVEVKPERTLKSEPVPALGGVHVDVNEMINAISGDNLTLLSPIPNSGAFSPKRKFSFETRSRDVPNESWTEPNVVNESCQSQSNYQNSHLPSKRKLSNDVYDSSAKRLMSYITYTNEGFPSVKVHLNLSFIQRLPDARHTSNSSMWPRMDVDHHGDERVFMPRRDLHESSGMSFPQQDMPQQHSYACEDGELSVSASPEEANKSDSSSDSDHGLQPAPGFPGYIMPGHSVELLRQETTDTSHDDEQENKGTMQNVNEEDDGEIVDEGDPEDSSQGTTSRSTSKVPFKVQKEKLDAQKNILAKVLGDRPSLPSQKIPKRKLDEVRQDDLKRQKQLHSRNPPHIIDRESVSHEDDREWDRKHHRSRERRNSGSSTSSRHSSRSERDTKRFSKYDRDHDKYRDLDRDKDHRDYDRDYEVSDRSKPFERRVRDWDAPSPPRRDCQTSGAYSNSSGGGMRNAMDNWGAITGKVERRSYSNQADTFRLEEEKQEAADHYLHEAKKLKHQADNLSDRLTKSLTYVEAVLSFIQCGNAMEHDPMSDNSNSIFTIYNDTLNLLRNICKFRSHSDSEVGDKERKLSVLSLRIQSLLCLKLFKLKKNQASKLRQALDEHNKTGPSKTPAPPSPYQMQWNKSLGTPSPMSPTPSPASVSSVEPVIGGSDSIVPRMLNGHLNSTYSSNSAVSSPASVSIPQRIHSVTQQYITTLNHLHQCHDLWDQADAQSCDHKAFFDELDYHCSILTLHSSILHLVKYVRLGLHRLKDT